MQITGESSALRRVTRVLWACKRAEKVGRFNF